MDLRLHHLHRSTKWLVGMIGVILFMPLFATILPKASREEATLLHDVYKSLHITGAVLFLGNIIVTGLWMLFAHRSKKVPVMQFAVKAVNWMDVFFTAPGAALLLLTGLLQAPHHGGIYTQSWITAGLILFSLSGVVWLLFLVPDQHRLITLSSNKMVKNGKLPKKFFKVLRRWYFFGTIATLLPLVALVIMVFKPRLW